MYGSGGPKNQKGQIVKINIPTKEKVTLKKKRG